MCSTFAEVKLFQVKPDKLSEFEDLVTTMVQEQEKQQGSVCVKYMKRFFIFDKIGNPPRELTKIVKCVKYFSFWEFDNKENYAKATEWFFVKYNKELQRLLIMPFDINCGYTVRRPEDR